MRTYSEITIDSETGELIRQIVRHEDYSGPVALAKGGAAKGDALKNAATGQEAFGNLMNEGQAIQGAELPFLEGEITNPQGFGQPTLNSMTTAAGQGASGAVSNATEQAKLRAGRTGNLGGQSAIIANAARSGANAQSDANLKTQIANAQEKMKQQQAGATGLAGLGDTDLKDSLAALGLSNEAINAWSGANKSAWGPFESIFGDLTAGASQAGAAKIAAG